MSNETPTVYDDDESDEMDRFDGLEETDEIDGFDESVSTDRKLDGSNEIDDASTQQRERAKKDGEPLSERISDAVCRNDVKEVARLFENEVPDEEFDDYAYHALICAASNANDVICGYLVDEGCDVNYAKNMFFPLMAACSSKYKDKQDALVRCVEILYQAGARVNVTNAYGASPLMIACDGCLENVVAKLLACKARVNVADNLGWTALFYAVKRGDSDIARLLLSDDGCDVDDVDKRGRTVFDIAREKNFAHLVDLLSKHRENDRCSSEDDRPNNRNNNRTSMEEDQLSRAEFVYEFTDHLSEIRAGFPFVVYRILRGMRMERYFTKFRRANVTLDQFLLVSYERLREVGVCFDFHRKVILYGIKRFLLHRWSRMEFDAHKSDDDLVTALNAQCELAFRTIVLKSAIRFIRSNENAFESVDHSDDLIAQHREILRFFDIYLDFIRDELVRIESRCDVIIEKYAPMKTPADYIAETKSSTNRYKKYFLMAAVAIAAYVCYCYGS